MKGYLLLIILPVLIFSSCTSREQKADALLTEGIHLIYAGDYSGAIVKIDQCIEYNPDMAEAYFHRSNARFNLKQTAEAIKDIDKAIALNPSYADAFFNRGTIWFYLGENKKACDDWKKSEELGKPNVGDKTRWCP